MTFPTQPQPLTVPPFKDAWYHDFAPPIHSLDRHGDFAPPLLALGMASGFFGLATDDDDECAIQFNKLNGIPTAPCHGWLYIETTARRIGGVGLEIIVGDGITTDGGGDFHLSTGRDWNVDQIGRDLNLQTARDINLNPGNDMNTEGGQDYNWGPGRDFNASAGNDFNVGATHIVSLASNSTVDPFELLSSGGFRIKLTTTGKQLVVRDSVNNPIYSVSEDSSTTHNLNSGKTLVINDGTGSPLVTYTG